MSKNGSTLDHHPTYEVVIGIEVHTQLNTNTKIFCTCSNAISTIPNSNICHICTGHPGVLPVLNEAVVVAGIKAGLATNSQIAQESFFDRKHYFYPDLPKGYQITQQYKPICLNGYIPIRLADGAVKKIKLRRIHIEEDAGKNTHVKASGESLVDLNRAGTPLLEIVSEPDISSSEEARAYLKMLRATVQYAGICTGNMQDGAFRADTNISVRKKGTTELGTKCELKNINSFKFIADAIEYEIERQIALLESGQKVKQETRLWDTKNKVTVSMRSKEEAADYRYFQDPDLPGIQISDELLQTVKAAMPELPFEKFDRYVTEYGLSPYEADILVEEYERAMYFEKAYSMHRSKAVVNWILRDILGYINQRQISLTECKVTPEHLAAIVKMIEDGLINSSSAKTVFETVAQTGQNPDEVVQEKGLHTVGSEDEFLLIAQKIIAQNSDIVAQYRSGKEKLFGFFVGQLMKETGGKASPQMINQIFKKLL